MSFAKQTEAVVSRGIEERKESLNHGEEISVEAWIPNSFEEKATKSAVGWSVLVNTYPWSKENK